jgi:hypothetical protein
VLIREPVGALYSTYARDLALCGHEVRGLGGLFVFVDQSAEDGFAAYPALGGEVDDLGGRWSPHGFHRTLCVYGGWQVRVVVR